MPEKWQHLPPCSYRRPSCNVSFDDLGGTVSPSENPDALLAHNTFYVREGVPFVRNKMGGGNYTEEDNTIIPLKTTVAMT